MNQFTAALFRLIESTIGRTMFNRIDENSVNATGLKELFTCIGGYLFLVKGNGLYKGVGAIFFPFFYYFDIFFNVLL